MGSSPDAAGAPGRTFSISGHVAGLYPGRTVPLVLTVRNPFPFPITIRSVTTAVSNASSRCTARYLRVTSFRGAVTAPGRRAVHVTVRAAMLFAAPDACEGAKFPLTYGGLATGPQR